MSIEKREELVHKSKLAEQTERFEDMLSFMKELVISSPQELSNDERNLLSVAYKNTVGSRRTAWRALTSIEQKEDQKGGKSNVVLIKAYKEEIEKELNTFCYDILKLIKDNIMDKCSTNEGKVFFLKMQGDYQRYISEYAQNDQHKQASEEAEAAYKQASVIAGEHLKTTDPVRLGLALNYSVFCYEVTFFRLFIFRSSATPPKPANSPSKPSMTPSPISSTLMRISIRMPPPLCSLSETI